MTPLPIDLPPPPRPLVGTLSLSCNVRCDVELDGRRAGSTPLVVPRLAVGKHTVRLLAQTDDSQSRRELQVQVAAGKTTEQKLTFGTGQLSLRVTPWADVKLDGKPVGQTPMPALVILEGPHELLLENAQLSAKKRVPVTVSAGKHQALTIEMKD